MDAIDPLAGKIGKGERFSNLGPGLEALRAKWGWIVALATTYILVGLIALYSVVTATVASVFVVGIMMLIAEVQNQ
jgi:uncharacterized membrane protein HdeD (DUF308 family)